MSGARGQAPEPQTRCLLEVNLTFGRDLRPCAGLQAMLATPAARIGTFEELRLRQTSRRLVVATPEGEMIAEACPACGARLDGRRTGPRG